MSTLKWQQLEETYALGDVVSTLAHITISTKHSSFRQSVVPLGQGLLQESSAKYPVEPQKLVKYAMLFMTASPGSPSHLLTPSKHRMPLGHSLLLTPIQVN